MSQDVVAVEPVIRTSRGQVDVQFLADVRKGLSARKKWLPSKYFYDEIGSRLFEEITELDEYYLTRTERAIMVSNIGQIAEELGERVVLIEYGSGSSTKTRLLLDHLVAGSAYVPIDISGDHLQQTADTIRLEYPDLAVVPIHDDYSTPVELPEIEGRRIVYYPGSTIGNFEPPAATRFLMRMRTVVGDGGGVLIGVDLRKDVRILEAAYNDHRGITAQFNLNLLRRVNRELQGRFNLDAFSHVAFFSERESRIEMHLESNIPQTVEVAAVPYVFEAGERIHTENSYKYDVDRFVSLASAAGLDTARVWTDPKRWFAVIYLTANR